MIEDSEEDTEEEEVDIQANLNFQVEEINLIDQQIVSILIQFIYREQSIQLSYFIILVKDDELVAVKLRGLPYQCRYEEVSELFKDFSYIERSVVLGLGNDGRKNGFGAILFGDEKEARDAVKEL